MKLNTLLLAMLLTGCQTHDSRQPDHAFQVSVLANQAWFVLQAHRELVPVVKSSPSSPLEGPIWAEFNETLAAIVPAADRSARQAEALNLIIPRVR
jgi:hypothetical protein